MAAPNQADDLLKKASSMVSPHQPDSNLSQSQSGIGLGKIKKLKPKAPSNMRSISPISDHKTQYREPPQTSSFLLDDVSAIQRTNEVPKITDKNAFSAIENFLSSPQH